MAIADDPARIAERARDEKEINPARAGRVAPDPTLIDKVNAAAAAEWSAAHG